MGYRDTDLPNPMEFFSVASEMLADDQQRLHQRLQLDEGQALFRLDQLNSFYDDLLDEPLIRMEYDRFSPGFSVHVEL